MARFENLVPKGKEENKGFLAKNISQQSQNTPKSNHMYGKSRWLLMFALFAIGSSLLMEYSDEIKPYASLIKSSLVEVPEIKWEGATMPIKEMAYRPALTAEDKKLHFDQLPTNKKAQLPVYDLLTMKKGLAQAGNNMQAWFTYLAYPVPHGGNYSFDATEMTGSHPGIDIATNTGTPVYAMASGMVTTAKNQPYGFGEHIIITHPNVPDPDKPGETTTLRSVYGHLSELLVAEGQIVKVGQLIGKVGSTGTSTSPHLHWQVERKNAPYAGFWPFNNSDLQAYGINSFFEGVKQGVGLDKLMKYTVHPAAYVRKYQTSELASAGNLDGQSLSANLLAPPVETYKPIKNDAVLDNPSVMGVYVKNPESYVIGEPMTFEVTAASSQSYKNPIKIRTNLGTLAQIEPAQLEASDFVDMKAEFSVKTSVQSGVVVFMEGQFGVKALDKVLPSGNQEPVAVNPAEIPPTPFINGEQSQEAIQNPSIEPKEEPKLENQAVNNEKAYEAPTSFADVDRKSYYGQAVMAWVAKGVIKGYADGKFNPDWPINRAEALKILMVAEGIAPVGGTRYADVPEGAWFAPWVNAASQLGIVRGYDDGLFKPSKEVTRAEFMKMALEASDRFVPNVSGGNIAPDVPADSWFGKYMAWAARHKALPSHLGALMKPGEPISRGEAVYILDKVVE